MNIILTDEAAQLLNTSIRTLQRQAKKGFFPVEVCGRVGRKYLFNKDELLSFIFSDKNRNLKAV